MEWNRSWPERIAVAGMVVWFYLGKLAWPHPLIFVYPRFQVDATRVESYLPSLAVLATLSLLWAYRRTRARGPFFAFAYFLVALFPVLGLVNHFFVRYSFVGDHFQYLASMGMMALAGAGIARTLARLNLWERPAGYASCLALLALLSLLTWRQCRMYHDDETLYQTTLDRNPDCWWAHNNLGSLLSERGQVDAAIGHFRAVLELNPEFHETHGNLADLLAGQGKLAEAVKEYRKAIEIRPDHVKSHCNLGNVLIRRGQIDEAIREYRQALEFEPRDVNTCRNLGDALARRGDIDEAIAAYRQALAINPGNADALTNLGGVLFLEDRLDEAMVYLQKAAQIKRDAGTLRNLALVSAKREALAKTVAQMRQAARLRPDNAAALNRAAWMLATNPNVSVRNGAEAVELARRAATLSAGKDPAILDTLAAAYAEAGRFDEAASTAEQAVRLAAAAGDRARADRIRARLGLYYNRSQPYRVSHGPGR